MITRNTRVAGRGTHALLLLAMCAGAALPHLGRAPLTLMEARNFVAAREMAEGGSWLIPTLNGALRLAKPPLPTWAVAAVLRAAGPDSPDLFLLRLPAALMLTLLVFFFWGLLRELTREQPGEAEAPGRTAWLGALLLASTFLLITVGREGQWDIFANSLMIGALWALLRGWRAPAGRAAGWLGLGGLLLGSSLLSKGPVALYAVLLPFAATFFSPLNPRRRAANAPGAGRARLPGLLLALGVGLGVGLAWPAYLAWQREVAPAALAVARLEISSWGERHSRPFWFYLNFPVFAGVWAPLALAALAAPWARGRAGRFVPYALGLGWLLLTLLLLSVVPEKKERYMLPLLPPLVLLTAGLLRYLETELRRPAPDVWARRLVRGWAGLLTLAALLAPVALSRVPGFGASTAAFWAAAAGFAVVAALVGWQGAGRGRVAAPLAGAVALMGLAVALLPAFHAWKSRRYEPGLRTIADLRANPRLAGLPWRCLEAPAPEQVWFAGRKLPVWPRGADSALVFPTGPVAVLSRPPRVRPTTAAGRRANQFATLPAALPAAWRGRVRRQVVDSFYLNKNPRDGYWRVTVLRPEP